MPVSTFSEHYKKLNPEQKKAVDTIEGPVMVIAGPGTGKTQILTLRIANILKETDTSPDSILALTFTEAGVSAMRKRLVSMIGPRAYRVGIYTFHGFCNTMIGRFPSDFPRLISSDPIPEIDKILLLRELIEKKEHLKELRPFYDNFAFVKDCASAISELKREYVNPTLFKELVKKSEAEFWAREDLYNKKGPYKGAMKTEHQKMQKKIEKNKELVEVYEGYEEGIRKQKLYDYEDMIGVVVARLEEDSTILQRLQEEYHYVLADEHQDANTAQNRLLELLMDFHDNPNLFIVGDEKQAIFRFQGASLENFLYFKQKYPEATLIPLERSYRSGQIILDVAHSIITSSSQQIERVKLIASADIQNETVEVRSFSSDALESLWIARDSARKIEEGVAPEKIAVLYRVNNDAEYISRLFLQEGVPHTIESHSNVLKDPSIAQFILLLRAVSFFGEKEFLAQALHARFLKFPPLDIFKILKHCSRERIELYECIFNEKILKKIGVSNPKAVAVFAKRMARWAEAGHNDPVVEVFNLILDESGFLTFVLNSTRSVEELQKLRGLARDIEMLASGNRDYTLSDLIRHLDLLTEYGIGVTKSGGSDGVRPGVRLMTAHGSKGLEFDYVYIVGAWDTHWGNRRRMSTFSLPLAGSSEDEDEDNADERRLFYVALTRAKVGVSISYAREEVRGKERLPSQFIEEIRPDLKKERETNSFEEKITPEVFLQKRPHKQGLGVSDKEYLRELFLEQGMSVTALNNYLSCPWNFFYSNLIRIPKIPNKYMILGDVVHKALAVYFKAYAQGKPKKDILLHAFDDALERTALSGGVYRQIEEKGKKALSGWFDAYKGSWRRENNNEYRIDTTLPLPQKESRELRVRGDLDKVEIHLDGVVVVDYKTGKPKSRNHLLGKTKARGAGDYFRQLVFYKMLLDREGRYRMKEGVIDFIEPKDNGTYSMERFEITSKDVEELTQTIGNVVEEILALSFWEKRCDDKKCEYCHLREMME
ncbi:MAG: ATP-dependent DNA helicase [Candidatus Paceibacterota bacterium]